jgi:hypothetical protein
MYHAAKHTKVDGTVESKVILAEHVFVKALERLRISLDSRTVLVDAAARRVDAILAGGRIDDVLAAAAGSDPWTDPAWVSENADTAAELHRADGTFKRFEYDLRAVGRRPSRGRPPRR